MDKLRLIGPFKQLLTMDDMPYKGPLNDNDLQVIEDAGIILRGEFIEAVGSYRELKSLTPVIEKTGGTYTVIPGLIDVHTHICWAGSRAGDAAKRLSGKSYVEIAAEGGGIWSTVIKTRQASEEILSHITASRAEIMLNDGVTTIEVKSGYGLNKDNELNMLKAIDTARSMTKADLVSTCLAAHIKPLDFNGTAAEYIEYVIEEILPAVKSADLSRRADIYIDKGAFTVEDGRMFMKSARELGFDVSVHADQFDRGGLKLAVEFNVVSADHLEATGEEDIRLIAESSVIPVALPGASLGLGERFAPARKLLNAGASLAIASDWNPGSAPMGKLLTQASILGVYEKLSMAETLAAITFRAAPVLRLTDRGILKPGMLADFIAYPCDDYREIVYCQGGLPVGRVWKRGRRVK